MNAARRTYAKVPMDTRLSVQGRIKRVNTVAFLAACIGFTSGCASSVATTEDTVPGGANGVTGSPASASATGGRSASGSSGAAGASGRATGNGGGSTGTNASTVGAGAPSVIQGGSVNGGSPAAGASGTEGSTCVAGVNTGSTCNPAVDTAVCDRSTRSCTCGADSTWTCTTKSGTGGAAGSSGAGTGTAGSGTAGSGTAGSGTAGSGTAGASTGATAGAGTTGGSPSTSFVENQGADCTIADVAAGAKNPKLPDPFKKLDGTRITTKSEWRCRRQEILRLAENFAYGEKPPKPESVTGTVTDSKITVNISHKGKTASFSADIVAPSKGAKPYPAIVGIVMPGFGTGLDSTLVSGEGVAMINYNVTAVGAESGSGSRNNKQGAFYTIYGATSKTGTMVAWAWGLSRIIDVIEQSGGSVIKADAMGVSGCSRFGKGAFTAGAFDQRVALTIPVESGSAGVPIWRGIPGEKAQSLSSAYGEQPWLGDAFGSNTGDPSAYPLDTHEVVAMVAPRGLLILDNPHIANLGPKSAHVAALAGAEVYKALGFGDSISYHSDTANGTHCSVRTEYAQPLKDSIQRFLTKTGTKGSGIAAHQNTTGKLSDWVDWTTPTLQ